MSDSTNIKVAVSPPGIDAISEIAINALVTADCGMVAVFAGHHGRFDLIKAIGVPETMLPELGKMTWLPVDHSSDEILHTVFHTRGEHEGLVLSLTQGDKDYAGFAAETAASDGARVILSVFTDGPRRSLSAAQGYCLHAYVAHIATLLMVDRGPLDGSESDHSTRKREQGERLRLLESVAVHARDSIIVTEAEPIGLPGPRIIYCNAAFTAATGYSEAEVLGKTPRILQGPKTDPVTKIKLREMLLAWKPIEVELLNYRKDGSEFWVELSIVPVADERGWYTHWVSVQRDITARRAAEELKTRILVAEVKNAAVTAEAQQKKRLETDLLFTAFHDNLTGLRNRDFFMMRLTNQLGRSEGQRGSCAVLFLDLDRFKAVNDSLGHSLGDTLLIEIAHRLTRCTRPQDTLARIGGDEFALLIDGADDLVTAVKISERIIEVLRAPVRLGGQDVYPSCSIGVVQALPGSLVAEDLIRDADIAMCRAKRSSRGDYAIFTESMRAEAVAALQLQTDLQRAVEQQEFLLNYQPIVDPTDGSILGFEALLRWRHPTRGMISPAEFIPMAEEMGLIREIDRRVMLEACLQLRSWQTRYDQPKLQMSVNAAACELSDPDYVNNLVTTLRETGVDPCTLEIEITEGLFLVQSAATIDTLGKIRELGVKIGLDDFGTGYSSLSYIDRYPIDTIKIDQSFTASICDKVSTKAIIELIINLGAALNVTIVAEGVESADQADLLIKMGCSRAQGYYFSRPLLLEGAQALLRSTQSLLAA